MKTISLCITTLLCLSLLPFAAQDFEWVRQMGGGTGKSEGRKVLTDRSGNVLTLGTFTGTVDTDLLSGAIPLHGSKQ